MMNVLDNVMRALSLNANAYDAVKRQFQIRMSELDVQNIIFASYQNDMGKMVDFDGDIIAGKRSAEVGGSATDYLIAAGDAIILDLLPEFDGCFCDTTRTFFVGEPSKQVKFAYETVLNSLKAGESILKPGVCAYQIYEACKNALGVFAHLFPHHAGHQIGVSRMMEPDFLPECDGVLTEGMIVTLEPGIYFEKEYGIRIENNYFITKDGCKNIFEYPLELDYFIL